MKNIRRMEKIIIDYRHPSERSETIALIDKENFFIVKNERLRPQDNIFRLIGEKPMKEKVEGKMHIEDENIILRRMLWLRHGCPQPFLYGDDGEMQCHQCGIDFKRTPAKEIENVFYEQHLRKLKREKKE